MAEHEEVYDEFVEAKGMPAGKVIAGCKCGVKDCPILREKQRRESPFVPRSAKELLG